MPLRVRVFLASPGDVMDERGLAMKVLSRLTVDPLLQGKITLDAVAWDHPEAKTTFLVGMSAQDSVIRSLGKPSMCDIVVVILWSRLGSPITQPDYARPNGAGYFSGTEWEYEEAWRAYRKHSKPVILLYHRTTYPDTKINPDQEPAIIERMNQIRQVKEFLKACNERDGSIPNEYQEPSEFEKCLENGLKSEIRRILDEMPQQVSSIPPKLLWKGSPFPGLRPFTDRDAPIFFGRGRETDDLVERIKAGNRFIAVIGASGSGKSSLVWAGLIPRLKAGALEGGPYWQWVRFTPGEIPGNPNPFTALALSFKPFLDRRGRSLSAVIEDIQQDAAKLEELVGMALEDKPQEADLVLFIDQFEELFTLVTSQTVQQDFIALLAQAASTKRLRTVVTIRADFYHRCLDWEELSVLLRTGSFPLATPGIGALYEIITRPAEYAGLTFEASLPERILNDTGTEPGALALMAFALYELYEARSDGCLTVSSYEKFGGVKDAIGKRADDTFKKLPVLVQATLGDVFRDFVEVDERGIPTRRPALLNQVIGSPEAQALVSGFTNARLLVTGRSEDGKSVVEVAHDALFRSWPYLKQWIQDTADDHRLRRQITQLAAYWKIQGFKEEHRWPDDRVVEVVRMLARLGLKTEDFTQLEQDFLGPLDPDCMLQKINDPSTTHEQRASIGVRLSLLGDPRPGVGLGADGLPDIEWVPIKGHKVTIEIRSNPDDPAAKADYAVDHTVESFSIARYPVTLAQFQAFLAECYRDGQWQLPRGFDLPASHPLPKHWTRYDNHPVDSITWIDAAAFCHWLGARLGFDVRLPTEAEWQLAATGGDPAKAYPWGTGWDPQREPWRANTLESGLNHSTAVGMYPAGASPAGVQDMAGTLWEWCRNAFHFPDNVELPKDSGDLRVIRGGSWNRDFAYARCTYRDGFFPHAKIHVIGFRGVRSMPG